MESRETGWGGRVSFLFFFQAEDGIRDSSVTGVQTCALPILGAGDLLKQFAVLGSQQKQPQRLFAADERGTTLIFGRLGWGPPPHLLTSVWSAQNRVRPASLLAKGDLRRRS